MSSRNFDAYKEDWAKTFWNFAVGTLTDCNSYICKDFAIKCKVPCCTKQDKVFHW